MKNEIRMAHGLPQFLEDKIFELLDHSGQLLEENDKEKALAEIQTAWELLPEPKFNTSCSHLILCDLIKILNISGKHKEAKLILEEWISDLKNCGFKIYETTPFILLGETHLYLEEVDKAKEAFLEAIKYGATKRDFSDKPAFYFDIAKKKITDNYAILELFDAEVIYSNKNSDSENSGISDEVSEQIEALSEEGNDFFDDEDYEKAINVWKQALKLIPEPQNTFSESFWLDTSIGDAYFMEGDHTNSFKHFGNAKNNIAENAYENAFIMLRIGQLFFELNDFDQAKEYLLRAYMFDGIEIFEGSKEKYFDFLKENVNLN